MSLQLKITLTILLSLATALGAVFVSTPYKIKQTFVTQAKEVHFERFTGFIEHYQSRYGEWGGKASAIDAAQKMRAPRRESNLRPRVSNPRRHESGEPIGYRFVVADHLGFVFVPFNGFEAGERLSAQQIEDAYPLYLYGDIVGYALGVGEPILSPREQAMLDSVNQTLMVTAGMAFVIALLLGSIISKGIVLRLEALTKATRKMAQGELKQDVKVVGWDEVAKLATNFNRMSHQLNKAYSDLQDSNRQIAKQAQDLAAMSITDELTGLHNRRYFAENYEKLFQQSQQRASTLSLVVGDVDHFKHINDNFGHDMGDQVLIALADIVRDWVRDSDLVVRFGGEELVILMPTTQDHESAELIEDLRTQIEVYPWHTLDSELKVTMSFGLTDTQYHENSRVMFKSADEALYQAKHSGRNQVCVSSA